MSSIFHSWTEIEWILKPIVSFATLFLINCKSTQEYMFHTKQFRMMWYQYRWTMSNNPHRSCTICSILDFITYQYAVQLSAFILIIQHLHISFVFHAFVYSTQSCSFLPDDIWMCTVYSKFASPSLFSYTYVGRVLFIVYDRVPTVCWLSYDFPAAES